MPMTNKFITVVTYHDEITCSSITCFCEVTWDIRYVIFPLAEDL